MESQIRCKVFPGQFSSEYAVKAQQTNGEWFSLFVPIVTVEVDEAVNRERAFDGWLKVEVWEVKDDKAIVKLPRESFESGRFVTVSVSQFKSHPESVEA